MLKAVAKILMKLKTTAVIEGLGEIKPIQELKIELITPTEGQQFNEGEDVTVEFEFNREAPEVDKVELRIDGSVSQTRTTAPFDADFTVSNLSADTHTIEVFAFEGAELLAADTVDVVVEAPAQELLLDIYPNTDGESWSLMQINSNYNGNILELRRDDNDTMLVQFENGQLPQAAIAAWAGSGKAYVTRWDGQSGNGLFVQQTNAVNQPWIYDNGFTLEGGKPTMIFDGNQYLDGGNILNPSTNPFISFVVNRVNSDIGFLYDKTEQWNKTISIRFVSDKRYSYLRSPDSTNHISIPISHSRELITQEVLPGISHIPYINNVAQPSTGAPSINEISANFIIGQGHNGTIQALHIYLNDVSANRSAITTEIMNRYGIS